MPHCNMKATSVVDCIHHVVNSVHRLLILEYICFVLLRKDRLRAKVKYALAHITLLLQTERVVNKSYLLHENANVSSIFSSRLDFSSRNRETFKDEAKKKAISIKKSWTPNFCDAFYSWKHMSVVFSFVLFHSYNSQFWKREREIATLVNLAKSINLIFPLLVVRSIYIVADQPVNVIYG